MSTSHQLRTTGQVTGKLLLLYLHKPEKIYLNTDVDGTNGNRPMIKSKVYLWPSHVNLLYQCLSGVKFIAE